MDARQHDLFKARLRKAFSFCPNFVNRSGANRAAHRRNDAVCAPAVAAFLNLHRCAGMPFVRMNGQMLKRRLTEGFDGNQSAILRHRLFEQLHDLSAPLRAQNEPNARKRCV